MEKQITLSVIKADVGGYVGHSSLHEQLLEEAKGYLEETHAQDLVLDFHLSNTVANDLRRHGPFEPHRLPMEEMEYTTLPQVMEKLEGRWMQLPE